MGKKNILIVTSVFPPEPVTSANLNYDLAVRLSDKYNVTVIHPEPSRPAGKKYTEEEKCVKGAFSVVVVPTYTHPQSEMRGRMKESISFGKCCANYIKEHREGIDFVYNCSWQLFGYYLVAKSCVKCGIPYMIPIQDIYPETLFTGKKLPGWVKTFALWVLGPIDKYYLKHASVIRTISDEMKSYLVASRNLPQDKFLVVNNWQDDENFSYSPPSASSSDTFKFVYLGSINNHSNVELMIRAFCKANLPNAKLMLFGGGNRKEACQELVRMSNATNVEFSIVERKDVPDVQSKADVLVLALPTGNGTLCLPSKLTSYMLSGRPVIASVDYDSTTAAYLQESQSGIIVQPDDEDSLAKAFRDVSRFDRNTLIRMGERSRTFALEHLTRKVNLNLVVAAIDKVLEVKQKG